MVFIFIFWFQLIQWIDHSIPKTYTAHICLKWLSWSSHAFMKNDHKFLIPTFFFQVLNTRTMKQVHNFFLSWSRPVASKSTAQNQLPKINSLAISCRRQCWLFCYYFLFIWKRKWIFYYDILYWLICFFLVKVGKSQKQFFLKLHCPKN